MAPDFPQGSGIFRSSLVRRYGALTRSHLAPAGTSLAPRYEARSLKSVCALAMTGAIGIDSISLNPDSVLKTMLAIVEAEKAIDTAEASHVVGANR